MFSLSEPLVTQSRPHVAGSIARDQGEGMRHGRDARHRQMAPLTRLEAEALHRPRSQMLFVLDQGVGR